MKCPKCFAEIDDSQHFCHYCGFAITTHTIKTTNDIYHNPTLNPHRQQEPQLIFNIIFAILLLFSGGNTCIGLIGSLPVLLTSSQGLSAIGLIITLCSAAVSACSVLTGIALLQRKRLGYIFATIINIIYSVGGLVLCGLGVWMNFIAATDQSEFARLGYVFGVLLLVCGLPVLIFNVCALRYYQKHKTYFK